MLGDAGLLGHGCLVLTYVAAGAHSPNRVRMDRSRHTEQPMGANQDRTALPVAPEVLRTSGGADAPAVVALRSPLRQTQLSCLGSLFLTQAF